MVTVMRRVRLSLSRSVYELAGFAEHCAEGDLRQPWTEALDRVDQHVPVFGVDVHGTAVGVGHLLCRPHVIDVTVGQQHRGRGQPVLVEDPPQGREGPLARIDADGVGSGPAGTDVAVATNIPPETLTGASPGFPSCSWVAAPARQYLAHRCRLGIEARRRREDCGADQNAAGDSQANSKQLERRAAQVKRRRLFTIICSTVGAIR
jgi:hypothetical protein